LCLAAAPIGAAAGAPWQTGSYELEAVWSAGAEPFAITPVGTDRLLVVRVPDRPDADFHTLAVFDLEGQLQWSSWVRDADDGMVRPVAAMAIRDGTYRVLGANVLVALDRLGDTLWSAPAGDGQIDFGPAARGLTESGGLLFSTDMANGRLAGYDLGSGALRRRLGSQGTGSGSYMTPLDVAAAGDDHMWVADFGNRRLVRTDAVGVVDTLLGMPARPRAVDVGADDTVFALLDDESVHVFLHDVEVGVFGGQGRFPGQFDMASDIAALPGGKLAVADRGNRRVQIFRPVAPTSRAATRSDSVPLASDTHPGGAAPTAALRSARAGLPAQVRTVVACPGEPALVDFEVDLSSTPPRSDVMLAVDTTGSMESVVSTLAARAGELAAGLAAESSDVAMGVLDVRDYPYGRAGLPTDLPFALRAPIAADPAGALAAAAALAATGGGDAPEAYGGALRYALAHPQVGWRPGAARFVVLLADSVPRDNDLNAGLVDPPVRGVWAPGVPARWPDSGLDWAPYSADDADWHTVLDEMRVAAVRLMPVVTGAAPPELSGNPDGLARYWDHWADTTGGRAILLRNLAELPLEIVGLVRDSVGYVSLLETQVQPESFRTWVQADPLQYDDVEVPAGGAVRSFELSIEAPAGTGQGVYPLLVRAVADGVWVATVELDLEWRPVCGVTPTPVEPTAVVETPSPTVPPTASPSNTPTPSPSATPTRAPTERPIAEGLFLPIVQKHYCAPGKAPGVDVVLALDASSSMAGDKLVAAKAAASGFVGELRQPTDRAAIVVFNRTASAVTQLTTNRVRLEAAIAAINVDEGTRVDLALREAVALLGANGRPGAARAIVLLTDGQPDAGTLDATYAAAAEAASQTIRVYAVGLGNDADIAVLTRIAGTRGAVFHAPGAGDLLAIYLDLAAGLPCR
jgi:uncharacterized protein YegL